MQDTANDLRELEREIARAIRAFEQEHRVHVVEVLRVTPRRHPADQTVPPDRVVVTVSAS